MSSFRHFFQCNLATSPESAEKCGFSRFTGQGQSKVNAMSSSRSRPKILVEDLEKSLNSFLKWFKCAPVFNNIPGLWDSLGCRNVCECIE